MRPYMADTDSEGTYSRLLCHELQHVLFCGTVYIGVHIYPVPFEEPARASRND